VVAQAATLGEARRMLGKRAVEFVVDFDLSDRSGAKFISDLRELDPRSMAMLLTGERRSRNPRPCPQGRG
jgi:ActR/RegA family two-component response regulator